MKSFSLVMAAVSMLTINANAGVLTCRGINPDNNQSLEVVVNSGSKTLSVNGATEAAQFAAGPDQGTLAVISKSAFLGVSTQGFTKAMINTAVLDQVSLSCDGKSL